MTLHPLAMYPWPVKPEHLALVKRAKAELNLDFQVLPTEAAPGGPVRVLAFGELPPWISDSALIRDPNVYESVLSALRWTLLAGAEDTRGHMVLDRLKELLGNDVTEVFDEVEQLVGTDKDSGVERKVAFR